MTTIILPHNHFDADHLAAVTIEMQGLGAPAIKAVWMECHGAWVALEGAHRLRAAHALGLTPEIEEIEWSDTVTTDEVAPGSYDDTWTIEQICDDAHTRIALKF
ncbi:MAG: hypothetical protein RLZZ501_1393 [Pseudomonadota bacterium]|jgi:hypothetical protein